MTGRIKTKFHYRDCTEPTMASEKSQSQSFHFRIYGISTSAISSPLSMAMAFPLVGSSSHFVLSRWIISSHLACCVFIESGCRCLILESRHLFLCLFVIENGGLLFRRTYARGRTSDTVRVWSDVLFFALSS